MNRPFTVAHLSDFHISAEHKRTMLRSVRRLLEAVVRHDPDHVVITGDIAADAHPGDFEIARRLFRNAGLLDSGKLSLVIGNHDIYGGVHRAEDILSFPRRCRKTDYGKRVDEFREYFHEAFDGCLFPSPDRVFPFAKILRDTVLIGVNSVAHYSGVKNPIGSNGNVDDSQFRKLKGLLGDPLFAGKRKLVLIHHQFNKMPRPDSGTLNSVWDAIERQTMKMRGKKRLSDLFRVHGVALVLHGHVHVNATYERRGIRFINGGGSVLGHSSSGEMSFNLIRVYDETVETRLITVSDEKPVLQAGIRVPEEVLEQIAA